MKLHYYPETDSLYIELKDTPGTQVREIVEGLVIDLDADGNVVGLDIDHASRKLDLSRMENNCVASCNSGRVISKSPSSRSSAPAKRKRSGGGGPCERVRPEVAGPMTSSAWWRGLPVLKPARHVEFVDYPFDQRGAGGKDTV